MKDSLGSSNDSLASTQSTTTITIKKPYVPKSKQRILPPPPKPRQSKASITFDVKLNDLNDDDTKLDEEDEIKSSNLNTQQHQDHQVKLFESEIFNFKPSISSSVNLNHESTMPLPPPPPPLPPFMTSSTMSSTLPLPNIPSPPPPPPFITDSTTLPPPPPPPPPFLGLSDELSINKPPKQSSQPVPLLFSSDSFKNELKLAKTTPKSASSKTKNQLKPIDNSAAHNRSFDINEIKTFKFKSNSRVNVKERPSLGSQNMNPWDSLMNEIRSNGGNKLKKVSDTPTSKSSKHMKFNNDDNLVRDLNQILSQRSQFFKDDDDNESSDDESWSGFVNN